MCEGEGEGGNWVCQQVVSGGHDYRAAAAVRATPPHKRRRREFSQSSQVTHSESHHLEQSLATTTQRLAYFVVEQASDDDERKGCLWIALPSPRRILMDRCSCCAGNNPLICQSARSKFQTHMDTNTCHDRVRQRAKAVTKGSNLISHSQASGLGVKVCFARGQSTYVVSVCSPVSMRRPSHG